MELVEIFSPVLGARCVVVASGGSALVIDAGVDVADRVVEVMAARGWAPRAVLATHGHLDHTWDAGPLSRRLAVPVLVHGADRYRLDDPIGTLGLDLGALAGAGVHAESYERPAQVLTLDDDRVPAMLHLPGVGVTVRHAPGHTEGSTLYLFSPDRTQTPGARPDPAMPGGGEVLAGGDVLFAGTIGRTDLAGGDGAAMAQTLRTVVGQLAPATTVLPGHGPRTTIARELRTNPYLVRRG